MSLQARVILAALRNPEDLNKGNNPLGLFVHGTKRLDPMASSPIEYSTVGPPSYINHMTILKTLYFSDSAPRDLLSCDTIKWQGKFWLVPSWLENLSTGRMRPLRIIALDSFGYRILPQGSPEAFAIDTQVPKCVFDGQSPPGTTFEIVESPEVEFPIPELLH